MTDIDTPHDDHRDPHDAQGTDGPGFPRWLKWGLLGALAVLVVGYGLIFLYAKVINDSPDELDESDLQAALATNGDATPGDGTGEEVVTPGATPSADGTPASEVITPGATPSVESTNPGREGAPPLPAAGSAPAALWRITDASELGYRVKEILFGVDTEGVGRTDQITGNLAIAGSTVTQAEFVVDVASITSDESRRDSQFRGRIMSTDEFPTATFALTQPIELGVEPAEGVSVTATAIGQLTLRGVTNPVTFDVTAQLQNGQIGVLGNIPVVFADYGIANPSIGGITTEDNGLLEFVLVFVPAA